MQRFILIIAFLIGCFSSQAQCPPANPLSTPYIEDFSSVAPGLTGSSFTNCWFSTTSINPKWESEDATGANENSLATGPWYDNTNFGQPGGMYMFLETSSPAAFGDSSSFISPLIDLSGLATPELTFYYHMYGSAIGELEVQIHSGSQWDSVYAVVGQQQTAGSDPWTKVVVPLTPYLNSNIRVRFLATIGATGNFAYESDFAIDDIRIDNQSLCPQPINNAANSVTATSADVIWDPGTIGASSWEVEYDTAGFSLGSGTIVPATVDSVNITGLMPATFYQAYIREACAGGGFSNWEGPVTFLTACAGFTAPYSNDFDADPTGAVPNCWFGYFPALFSNVQIVSFGPVNSTPNHLELSTGLASPADTILAVSPQLSDMTMNDKQFSFYAAANNTANVLYVGTMASQSPGATFNPLDTIVFTTTNSSNEYIVALNAATGYNGTDQYLAFRNSASATFGAIYIDDLTYEVAPPCPKIIANQINLGASATTINLNVPGANMDVEWGPCGYTQGTGTFVSNVSSPYQLTGLAPSTCYDIYIRRNCTNAGNGSSTWTGPFSVSTTCLPSTLPFVESFNTWPLSCWDTTGGTNFWSPFAGAGGDTYALADFWSVSQGNYLLTSSPIIVNQQAQVHFFWSHLANIVSYPDEALVIRAQSLSTGIWDTVLYIRSIDGNFNDPTASNTAPGSFVEEIIQLSAAYIGDTIRVQIEGVSDFGPNCYLNNFAVEATPACVPTSLANISVGSGSNNVTASWTPGSGVVFKVEVGIPGFTPGTGTGIDSLSTTMTSATIGGLTPNTTYELYLQDSCADGSVSPYVGPISFTTKCTAIPMTVYESLDLWPLVCWDTTQGSLDWSKYNGPSGDNYAFADFWSNSSGDYKLTSPPISISQDAQLRFFWSHQYQTFYPNDQLVVRAQVAGTTTWDTLLNLQGDPDFNDPSAGATTPGNFIMEEVLLNPSVYTGNDIIIEFVGVTGFGPNCYLNDIYVEPAPQCPKPGSLNAAVLDTFAVFDWVGSSAHSNYEVWFGPQGFYQGSATLGGFKTFTTADSLIVDTLRAATCYEFLVRAICPPADTTVWEGPYSFCTNCRPYTMPYFESYDVWPPLCWSIDIGTVDWRAYSVGPDGWAEADFWGNSVGTMVMNSPPVLITEAAQLRYTWSHLANTVSYPDDELIVRATVAGSGIWDTLDMKKSINGNFDDPTAGNTAVGTGIEDILLLDTTKYNGNQIIIQFWGNTDFGPNCYINDFFIEKVPTCPKPDSLDATNIGLNSADLSWIAGTVGNSNFEIEYGSGLTFNTIGSGTRLTLTGTIYNLVGLMPATNYCYFVREICAVGDTSSWVGPLCFSTNCPPAIMAPWAETFAGAGVGHWDGLDNCWSFNSNNPGFSADGGYSWEVRNTPQATSGTSTGPDKDNTLFPNAGGTFITADVSGSSLSDSTFLVSPVIDISGLSNPQLEYHVHRFGTQMADLYIDIFDGTNWNRGVHVYTNQAGIQTSQGDAWTDTTVSLSAYSSGGTIQVRFRSVSNGCCAGDNAIDDVSITDLGGCPLPSNLTSTAQACDEITLTWNSPSGGSILAYGPQGFTPPAGMLTGIVTSPYTITGLSSGTAYDVYVLDTCAGDTSQIVGPITVSTSGVVVTASFTTTLGAAGAVSRTVFFDASASTGATNYDWDFGNGSTGTGQNTSHMFTSNSSYNVKLVVSSACGIDSVTNMVVVQGIGLAESLLNSTLEIFPNPANNQVSLSFSRENAEAKIALVDLSGKELMVREISNSEDFYSGTLDIANLASGVYMLQITDGETVVNRRLIKN